MDVETITFKTDEELVWAKLNGDWYSVDYRFYLATKGDCLMKLITDSDEIVRRQAMVSLNAILRG